MRFTFSPLYLEVSLHSYDTTELRPPEKHRFDTFDFAILSYKRLGEWRALFSIHATFQVHNYAWNNKQGYPRKYGIDFLHIKWLWKHSRLWAWTITERKLMPMGKRGHATP